MLAAVAAAVRHRLVILGLYDILAGAVTTNRGIAPTLIFKVETSSFFIRDLLKELV